MKNIAFILLFIVLALTRGFSQVCCPDFELRSKMIRSCNQNDCLPDSGNQQSNNPDLKKPILVACKNQSQQYLVVPNDPLFTYNWTVIGGIVEVTPDNPAIVCWGNSQEGIIQVIITSTDGSCRDTLTRKFCLIDGPTAVITVIPNQVCLNSTVQFYGSSSIGATEFNWDFGDGSSSDLQNPDHEFNTSGIFPVVLTVSNENSKGFECGCIDTAIVLIEVIDSAGIDIHTDDCRKMLCTNDTVVYCTNTPGCTNLYWNVTGGTILSGQGDTCITVTWDQPSEFPTNVTLTANCPGACGNSATLNVPVLYPNLPIQGPLTVCPRSRETYSLPALPGTFYDWTISGGGTIEEYDHNINFINVNWWSSSGNYQIICNYNNPYSGCHGGDTIIVKIRPKFTINGISPVCEGDIANYCTSDTSNGWVISPSSGFSSTILGSNCQRIKWDSAGSYSITAFPVTATNFCNDSATMNVIVNPTPVLNPITGTDTICPGQLYNYSVRSNVNGGRFEWVLISGTGSIYPYGPNDSLASVIFSGAVPWKLQVKQTVNECSDSVDLFISQVVAPTGITLSPGSVCSGGIVTATQTGGDPSAEYTWGSSPGAILFSGQGTTSATFIVNDTATITVSNCMGSISTSVFTIPFAISISKVSTTCSAVLTATPGYDSYQWFLDGTSIGSGNPITVAHNGNYVVQVYNGGCISIGQIIITDIDPVETIITATGNLVPGNSITLEAVYSANCTTPSFSWSNGATTNPITVNTAGNYSVTVTCDNGCSSSSNIVISSGSGGINPGNCISDLTITGNNNCNNPVNLSVNTVCSPSNTTWLYGDGSYGFSGTHFYEYPGTYTVFVYTVCSDSTVHCGSIDVIVPMVPSFTWVVSCDSVKWNIELEDASLVLPPDSDYTIAWSASCGSFHTATNISNPELFVLFGCNPTVTLSISHGTCTVSKSYSFNFPITPLSIIGPFTVCLGDTNSFRSSYTDALLYNWNFGDSTAGSVDPVIHAFNGSPSNPVMTLHITDQYGCEFSAAKPVTVNIPDSLRILPSKLVEICPDCLPPSKLRANPSIGFSDFQWNQNGNDIVGANDSIYLLCNFNASGNYFVKAIDAGVNCPVTSDTVQVVYQSKPVADIQGNTINCVDTSPPYYFNFNNLGGFDSLYLYSWTASGPGPVNFIPDSLHYFANVSVSNPGTYQFILTVEDTTTHCIAIDTFCINVYINPTVTVVPPGYFCEGINHTFTAIVSPSNPDYLYQWSNGAIGNLMTTAQAGGYHVTVTDPVSGCSNTVSTDLIKERPYVELFPLGCDTICDSLINTTVLIPPLPTDSFPPNYGYYNNYTINWYDNDTLIHTGWDLLLSMLPSPILGQHHINIEVNFSVDSCVSTSGYYDLVIVPCYCDCEPSRFLDLYWSDNNNHEEEFCCGSSIEDIACNNPLTFHAQFQCDTVTCNNPVSYSLFTGGSFYSNGIMPFSTAGLPDGTYTLMMFGKCGDIICDTCIVNFKIDCPCCPQEDEIIIVSGNKNLSQQTYLGNGYSLFTTEVSIAGGTTPYTQVRADVIDFQLAANYNDCINCSNFPFTWASLGATSLAGINPSTTGATPTVGYFVPSNRFCNPREVVWNNGLPIDLSSTQNIKLLIYLPPLSKIPCCALKAKVCVKFSFYDINCNLCEKVECYEIILGETTSYSICCCDKWDDTPAYIFPIWIKDKGETKDLSIDSSPVTDTPRSKSGSPVNCGSTIKLIKRLYHIVAPVFHCTPTACNTTYSWSVTGPVSGNGTGSAFNFNFQMYGNYVVTFTPKCGDCECQPCSFTVRIKRKCIF